MGRRHEHDHDAGRTNRFLRVADRVSYAIGTWRNIAVSIILVGTWFVRGRSQTLLTRHRRRGSLLQPSLAGGPQSGCEDGQSEEPEWLSALRRKLVDAGYEAPRVDALLAAAVGRLQSGRVRDYVPLLVERSVSRELHAR